MCVAGARVCACRLRVRGGLMRWCVLGHGGKCVRVRRVVKKWYGISACLPAAPGRCSAHHRVELVVPLLLAVVHEAEKLAEAHVVYVGFFDPYTHILRGQGPGLVNVLWAEAQTTQTS